MGKQKKSKRRYSPRQSSSRRSRSLSSRSSSSQSYRHRSKKHKHKQDKRRKHESKKDRKQNKQEKRQDRKQTKRQRQNQRQRQRLPKIQQPIENMRDRQLHSMKEEKIQAQKIEYMNRQQQRQHQGRQFVRNQINPQLQIQQQNKPKKQQPNFQPSGILLEYYNSRQGVSLRFHQPLQGRQPQQQWCMYIFKGEQVLKPIELTKSNYLIGKDDRVVDILAQNPSISRQHCVLQFRLIQRRQTQGDYSQTIKPYIMDLQSTNGTFLNDERIQSGRYYELLHRDVLKFGFSDREYVIVKWDENQQSQQVDEDN